MLHFTTPASIPPLLALALSMTACGPNIEFAATNPAPRALRPRDPQQVAVFTSKRPQRAYVEVGLLEAKEGSTGPQSGPALIALLRQHAGRRGCDGLIITAHDKRFGPVPGFDTEGRDYAVVQATCIVYR